VGAGVLAGAGVALRCCDAVDPYVVGFHAAARSCTYANRFSHGASDDGGRDEFDESADNRRSNSAIRSA
jgi:hypothetical protein